MLENTENTQTETKQVVIIYYSKNIIFLATDFFYKYKHS